MTPIPNSPAASAALPWRDDLPRGRHLVTARWLSDLLQGKNVGAAPAAHWRLFDVHCDGAALFALGHIPGAACLDTNHLEEEPLWNKVPDGQLLRLLANIGVTCNSTVILYGRNTTAAARAAHLMLYAGVQDVRLLDGGLSAWTAAGLSLASGVPQVYPPAHHFGAGLPCNPQYLAHTPEVRSLATSSNATLVSIRTWDEFSGRTSGYDYISARGEIPGAVWGRAGEAGDMNSMSAFQNPDGTMKPARDILAFWCAEGIAGDRKTVFYCGTGWRASLAFFYAWLMGWDDIAVYDGGWFEWSSDPANPRLVGAPDHTMHSAQYGP